MGSVNRPKSSKQRHRLADKRKKLRHNAKEKHVASKRSLLKHRGKKRTEGGASRCSAEILLNEVKTGKVVASADVLDARALTDLLKTRGPEGRETLAADHLPQSALPVGMEKINEILDQEEAARSNNTHERNTNQYARRGPSFVFWNRIGLHPLLLQALRDLHFTHPTPVQSETLPSIMAHDYSDRNPDHRGEDFMKDFVVSAETGSGKTLVFALPILHRILRDKNVPASHHEERLRVPIRDTQGVLEGKLPENEDKSSSAHLTDGEDSDDDHGSRPVTAAHPAVVLHSLILTPTRELALQIHDMMVKLTARCKDLVSVACIVGGMALSKQQRILNRRPDVLICTPGRLWDLVQKTEGTFLGHSISRRLNFVVLDEADRLVESNRFEELKKILERIHCDVLPRGPEPVAEDETLTEGTWDPVAREFVPITRPQKHKKDEPQPMPYPPEPPASHRTTFIVTSATLSLQVNFQNKNIRDKKILRTKNASTMHLVMNDLGMNSKKCRIFDLAPDAAVVARLQETYLRCPEGSKELYLLYFIRQYCKTDRVIIFVNAISMLRRLVKILEILQCSVAGLHASMQQRQRLKCIDKFRAGVKNVLVATDVAARGLDVEGIKYVVHYQLARSTDAYIHRCGRTARCGSEGFSCVFVHPDEFHPFQKLMHSMGRTAKIEVLSLDQTIVRKLHPQLKAALEVDQMARSIRKDHAKQTWVSRLAKEADLDADDMLDDTTEQRNREKQKHMKKMLAVLNAMMRQDSGAKGAYRTSPRVLGAADAVAGVHSRAQRQVRMNRAKKVK